MKTYLVAISVSSDTHIDAIHNYIADNYEHIRLFDTAWIISIRDSYDVDMISKEIHEKLGKGNHRFVIAELKDYVAGRFNSDICDYLDQLQLS